MNSSPLIFLAENWNLKYILVHNSNYEFQFIKMNARGVIEFFLLFFRIISVKLIVKLLSAHSYYITEI